MPTSPSSTGSMPPDVKSPAQESGGFVKTYLAWSNERWVLSSTGAWEDVTGASVNVSYGPGTGSWGALLVVTFSAESHVSASDNNGVLGMEVLVNGDLAHPISDNNRFNSAAKDKEWQALSLTRVVTLAPSTSVQTAALKVRVKASSHCKPSDTGVQNWVLRVDRYEI